MLVTEVMLYLDDQLDFIDLDLTGTSGNLFDNSMPSSPEEAFMVENTGGYPKSLKITKQQEPAFRILIRGGQDPRVPRGYGQDIIDLIGHFKKDIFAPPSGPWSSATTYSAKAVIEHGSQNYVALQGSTDIEPGVDSSWENYWQELEGHFVDKCQAVQPRPVNVGRDDNDRFRFSTNFELKTEVN